MMTAPPKEKAAQDQPGGKAGNACGINKTHGGVPVKLPAREPVFRIFKDPAGRLVVTILNEKEAADWHARQ
jgi:hypothetical protein